MLENVQMFLTIFRILNVWFLRGCICALLMNCALPMPKKTILKTPHLMQRPSIYLLRKPSSNPLCPKFCCHGNKGRSGKNSCGIIRWPIHENPPINANILQDISYTDRVIVNFVPKFVAIATGVGKEKNVMTPSDSAGPKIGGNCKQLAIFF